MARYLVRNEETVYIAQHFVATNSTVRKTAKALGLSKSQVHERLRVFIERSDLYYTEDERKLACEVEKLINKNTLERATRGGHATRKSFETKKLQNRRRTAHV